MGGVELAFGLLQARVRTRTGRGRAAWVLKTHHFLPEDVLSRINMPRGQGAKALHYGVLACFVRLEESQSSS